MVCILSEKISLNVLKFFFTEFTSGVRTRREIKVKLRSQKKEKEIFKCSQIPQTVL